MLQVLARLPYNPLGSRPIWIGLRLVHSPDAFSGYTWVNDPLFYESKVRGDILPVPGLGPHTRKGGGPVSAELIIVTTEEVLDPLLSKLRLTTKAALQDRVPFFSNIIVSVQDTLARSENYCVNKHALFGRGELLL